MEDWLCMHTFKFENSTKVESVEYKKQLRISKLITNDDYKLFVNIRSFAHVEEQEIPTKIGVTLFPIEFKWVMKKIIKRKCGFKILGQRSIKVIKYTNKSDNSESYTIKIITPNKESYIWLNTQEIEYLKVRFEIISGLIRQEIFILKDQMNENVNSIIID